MNSTMNDLIIEQIEVRLIECGIHRVMECIERLDDDQLNYRPNSNSNSINNQVLHLDGNVRQWLIAALTGTSDTRLRDAEFDPENEKGKKTLIGVMQALAADIRAIYPTIKQMDLSEKRDVQCYTEPVLSIIIHVIEHFSYHLGQITYITKMLLDIDTGYYADLNLNQVN